MAITTYAIATECGVEQLKGVKVNDYFAVAPVYNDESLASGFCVTHLPTGRYVQGFYNPKHANDFRRASFACCKMLVKVWDCWSFECWGEVDEQSRAGIHQIVADFSYIDQCEKHG